MEETKEPWNLGDGLENVCNSVMRKLHYGGGSAYEIRGAYSGRIYHRSYNNGGSNLAKYSENEVTDTPFYTTLRLRGDDVSNGWCVPVIGIWMDDYDIFKKGKEDG